MKFNWGLVIIAIMTIGIWYSIFTIGFFVTLCWIIIFSAILGLWLRLSGRA